MRKRRDSGSRFGAVAFTGVAFLCIALGLTGCEEEADSSGENKIIAFKIGDTYGSIAEIDQQISITVPANTNLTALQPVVTISADASVNPASEESVNITHPVSYTVTAENGVTRTYTVTVNKEATDVVLEEIKVRSLPIQTIYQTGESFSPAGLVIVGFYSDNTVREEIGYTLSPLPVDLSTEGDQEITVSFGGKTETFTVSARDAILESISAAPLKTYYTYDEPFQVQDIVVTGYYADGTTKTETVEDSEVSGYDSQKVGIQTLLVTKNGKTATFTVSVQQVVLEFISVEPLKTSYAYDETFNNADIIVTGYYSDGTTKTETVEVSDVTGYDSKKAGYQTLVVTLEGKTATFGVTVGAKREISVSIGLPNDSDQQPEIFGLPAEGIKLSDRQNNNLPSRIVISAAGSAWNSVYTDVSWYIDGKYVSSGNILEIFASDGYALKIPHSITFVGTRGGVEYSRIIPFTVDK